MEAPTASATATETPCAPYTFETLSAHLRARPPQNWLVKDMIRPLSVNVLVADSGVGKSPLLYQAGLCLATGKPFLNMPTEKASVLYLEYENPYSLSHDYQERLHRFLAIEPPESFTVFNANENPLSGRDDALRIVSEWAQTVAPPRVVILDPLAYFDSAVEERNDNATRTFKRLRSFCQDNGVAFLLSHHTRKGSSDPRYVRTSLEHARVQEWLNAARGARNIINLSDLRLALDYRAAGLNSPDENRLVCKGFVRGGSYIGPLYLTRRFSDGVPIGYEVEPK